MEEFVLPSSLNLIALWDVDVNHVLTGVQLVCPNGEFGDVHFVGDIVHSATAITVEESFDDVADELDIDITPLRKTGSETE